MSELREVFEFLGSEREDVRKMASQGLSLLSGDATKLPLLTSLLVSDPSLIAALTSLLSAKNPNTLGDILTTFINCAADAPCAEAFSRNRVVQRSMRLLDALEASDLPGHILPVYKEMTLMVLNNLTASNVIAIQDLLQLEDEDLAGYFVTRLGMLYARHAVVEGAPQPQRDLRKWFLQIALNITRTPDGQRTLLSEDWPEHLLDVLNTSPNPMLRLLAAQTLSNCAATPDNHLVLVKTTVVSSVLGRLSRGLEAQPTQMVLAELLASMMQSEPGMSCLEGLNARKYLVAVSDGHIDASGDEDAVRNAVVPEVADFIRQHILPLLEEIQDAYVHEEA